MDIFNSVDQTAEREEIFNKWKEKYPEAPEAFINDKVESDLYIKTLERQKDELRNDFIKTQEDLQARTNLQDLIDRLNSQAPQHTPAPQGDTEKPTGLTPEQVEQLVLSKIEQNKLLDKEKTNFDMVQSKLQERFGKNAAEILREQANTMGLSNDDVNALARKSPEAFFRIMGLNDQRREGFMAPPRGDQRNDNFAPRTEKRTWSWYQNLKRSNPKQYYDPKTQVQMHKDADQLGSAFEDGDFNAYGPN